jgi:hypothetical protein
VLPLRVGVKLGSLATVAVTAASECSFTPARSATPFPRAASKGSATPPAPSSKVSRLYKLGLN